MMKRVTAALLTALLALNAVPAFAETATTPSVTAKVAPEVVAVTDSRGNQVDAIIRDADQGEVIGVLTGALEVTAYVERETKSEEIEQNLTLAYEQVQEKPLEELTDNLDGYLEENSDGVTTEDLIVADVFDVTLEGTYENYLDQPGNTLTIIFRTDWPEDRFLIVMYNCHVTESDHWEIISPEKVVRNGDGTLSVTFDTLCPVLFVADKSELPVDPEHTSPQTGGAQELLWITLTAALSAAGLSAAAVWKRNRRQGTR